LSLVKVRSVLAGDGWTVTRSMFSTPIAAGAAGAAGAA
jgi:hypothetical protein